MRNPKRARLSERDKLKTKMATRVRVGPKGGLYTMKKSGVKRYLSGEIKDYVKDPQKLKEVLALQASRRRRAPSISAVSSSSRSPDRETKRAAAAWSAPRHASAVQSAACDCPPRAIPEKSQAAAVAVPEAKGIERTALRESCESQYRVMVERGIANGRNANVFEACLKDDYSKACDYVVRVENAANKSLSSLETKYYYQSLLAGANLAPRVLDMWVCRNVPRHSRALASTSKGPTSERYRNLRGRWDALEDDMPYLFVVMDKVPGVTLNLAIRTMTAADMERVWTAIEVMQEYRILHNDLHSENIMITPTGQVLILDFEKAARSREPLDETDRSRDVAVLKEELEKDVRNAAKEEGFAWTPLLRQLAK